MSETDERRAPAPPEPAPSRLSRSVVAVLTGVAAAALAGVLVTAVRTGPAPAVDNAPPAAGARPGPALPPAGTGHDPLAADARSGTEAAVRGNWPLLAHDEFDGTALDTGLWGPYSGETTGGVGRHDPANLTVAGGMLTITSHGYSSGGLAWARGQRYGRWEVRARSQAGSGYGPVLLLWPDAEDWPRGGEIDFAEIPNGDRHESHVTVHYGADDSQNGVTVPGDFTQWHDFAVEWTPEHIAAFVDGREVFRTTDPRQIPARSMHLAIQQDIGPYGTNWIPRVDASTPAQVRLQIDWVRIYGL